MNSRLIAEDALGPRVTIDELLQGTLPLHLQKGKLLSFLRFT